MKHLQRCTRRATVFMAIGLVALVMSAAEVQAQEAGTTQIFVGYSFIDMKYLQGRIPRHLANSLPHDRD